MKYSPKELVKRLRGASTSLKKAEVERDASLYLKISRLYTQFKKEYSDIMSDGFQVKDIVAFFEMGKRGVIFANEELITLSGPDKKKVVTETLLSMWGANSKKLPWFLQIVPFKRKIVVMLIDAIIEFFVKEEKSKGADE